MKRDIFPLSIAHGYAFCNRTEEQDILLNHINKMNHVVLLAPRRYGKSSLVHQVKEHWASQKGKKAGIGISLYSVYNAAMAVELIVKGAQKIINEMMPLLNTEDVKKFFTSFSGVGLNASLNTNGAGFGIEFKLDRTNPDTHYSISSISEVLSKMDKLASDLGWRLVFEMDEFQEIGSLKESKAIEAQIRDAVQFSKASSFIFLGSNRHMLEQMFTEKSHPFFSMCHSIHLDRIKAIHYEQHISNASRSQWGKEIQSEVIQSILTLTERHPFYVNALCSALWNMDDPPMIDDVLHAWGRVVLEKAPMLRTEFSHLSATQKAILNCLALAPEAQITRALFIQKMNLPVSTVKDGFTYLQRKDLVYKNEQGKWAVMDPCLAFDLRKQFKPELL